MNIQLFKNWNIKDAILIGVLGLAVVIAVVIAVAFASVRLLTV